MSKEDNKQLVPRLRFPEFQESWVKERIGNFLHESRIKGNTGNIAKKITVKLWGNGVFEKQETSKGSENTQYFRRKAGQFIYSKLDFLNQAFGIIPSHLNHFESTVDLPCFDISKNLDAKFLLEYVQRKDFYKKYGEIADGGRKAKRIQVETFLEFPIYLPNILEQKKIADCLTSLDDLITAEVRKLESYKNHKKGLMQKLFPTEGKSLPEWRLPEFLSSEEWIKTTIGHIGDVLMCKRIFADQTNENGGIPFYKIGTLGGEPDAYISKDLYDEYKSKYKYPRKGEVLLTCSGTVGKCVPYDGQDAYYQDSNIVWIDNPSLAITNELLFNILCNVNWEKLNSTTIRRIYGSDLRNLSIAYPISKIEQLKIADFLNTVDVLITAQGQKIDALKNYKIGMIQSLFLSDGEVCM